MTTRDQQRVEVLARWIAGILTKDEAVGLLGLSERSAWRLRGRLLTKGADGLVHRNRGRASPRGLDPSTRARIIELAGPHGLYEGVNDCHLAELLAAEEEIFIGRSTLQRVLRGAGLASPRHRRAPRYRSRRERMAQAGLLVQIDGSRHDWLQGRGPELALVGGIYHPSFLDRAARRTSTVDDLLQTAFLRGLSTRETAALAERLTGVSLSAATISRLTAQLDGAVGAFHRRRIRLPVPYLLLDGLWVSVRGANGHASRRVVLAAYGIGADGTRELLDYRQALGESATAWGVLLRSLIGRGLDPTIWIHREAFPFLTPRVEVWLSRHARGRLILDFDDALYASPPSGRDWRRILRSPRGFEGVASCADKVLAGSPELVPWAAKRGVQAELVPTCVDMERVRPRARGTNATVTIGWIGSWSTSEYLLSIAGALRKVSELEGVRILFVGAANLAGLHTVMPDAEWRLWNLEREQDDLADFDIGIMAVPDTEWNRGKCALKLIEYMAAGIPFVASPVGMNDETATRSGGGILCETEDEWIATLTNLVRDPELRERLGMAGRAYAVEHYDRTK